MRKTLICLSAIISFNNVVYAEEVSFSQFSKIKDSASRIGSFIGLVAGCEKDPLISDTVNGALGLNGSMVSSSEVKDIVIDVMEQSGLSDERLSALDDIIRQRQGEMQTKMTQALAVAFEDSMSLCITALSETPSFKDNPKLPKDPIERISAFASLSPLAQ